MGTSSQLEETDQDTFPNMAHGLGLPMHASAGKLRFMIESKLRVSEREPLSMEDEEGLL